MCNGSSLYILNAPVVKLLIESINFSERQKMIRSSSISMPSLAAIARRTPALGEKD